MKKWTDETMQLTAWMDDPTWPEWIDETMRLTAWMDDPEAEGGWMYAPDFLCLLVEVFIWLFPEKRRKMYKAYACWNQARNIEPGRSTLEYSVRKRMKLELVQRFLAKPNFDAFIEWLETDV